MGWRADGADMPVRLECTHSARPTYVARSRFPSQGIRTIKRVKITAQKTLQFLKKIEKSLDNAIQVAGYGGFASPHPELPSNPHRTNGLRWPFESGEREVMGLEAKIFP